MVGDSLFVCACPRLRNFSNSVILNGFEKMRQFFWLLCVCASLPQLGAYYRRPSTAWVPVRSSSLVGFHSRPSNLPSRCSSFQLTRRRAEYTEGMRNERQDTQGYAAGETSGGVPAAGEASVSQPHVPSAYTDDRGIRDYRLLNNVANLYRDTGILHSAGDEEIFLAARENVAQAIKPKTSGTDPRMMALPRYSMFPVPPAGHEMDFEQSVHSGGLALLRLYHESARPVIAYYWYKNCAMCKLMKPVLTRVLQEYEGEGLIHYVDVEISINKKTMSHAGVRSIPAIQVFRNGKMVSHFSGLQTVSAMRKHFGDAVTDHAEVAKAAERLAAVELGSLLSGWRSNLHHD